MIIHLLMQYLIIGAGKRACDLVQSFQQALDLL